MDNKSYYFSHDANARNDIKIIKLRRELGLEGYGAFWCVIEILRETNDFKLPISAIDDIAFDISYPKDKLDKIINHYGLFNVDERYFMSKRLKTSMDKYQAKKKALSAGGKKGMATRWKGNGNGHSSNGMVL